MDLARSLLAGLNAAMIQLYTWSTPNGRKVSIALEELGLSYQVTAVDITRNEQFAADFLKISPNNKIPVIVDETTGVTMMESGAILLYLADTYDGLIGDDYWQTVQWLMLQMGSLGPMLGQAHHFLKFNPGVSGYAEKRYREEAERLYGVLNRRLEAEPFLAGGSYTIADIATWPWIARYEWQEMELSLYPALKRWYLQIAERDAVRRGYDVPSVGAEIPIPDSR